MSKNLFIIRHAKAGEGMPDFDRPLHPNGISEAIQMADKIAQYNPRPHHLVSSPAKRALGTAQLFADALQIPRDEIKQDQRIYEGDLFTITDLILNFDDRHENIAIFGHNPDIGALVGHLGDSFFDRFPTCAVAHLEFAEGLPWKDIQRQEGKIRLLIYP